MEPELRWWRVVLSWRGRIVRDECVRDGLSVGDATAWAIPGVVAAEHALVRDGKVCPPEGLAIEPGEGTRLRSVAHPDVVLEVTAESGPRPRYRGEWLPGLARDAAYGLIVLGCVISFLAVARAQSDVEVRGEKGDGRIERAMHEAMPVAFVAPMELAAPAQPMPEVEAEVEPIEEDVVLPEATPVATKPVAAVAKKKPTARKPKSTPTQPSPRRDSHDAAGDARAPGTGEGLAAVAPAKPCADPRIDPKSQVDVVFVLDVSTTMAFVLDRLAREIAAVDAEVRKHDATPHYGLVVFVDDVQVVGGGKAFTDIDELAREFRKWSAFTADNGQIRHASDNLDWPENSLDALHAAATDFAWRDADDTVRVVVHATDDSFGKAGDVLSGAITVQHDYGDTVAALRDAHVRVATFTAPIGGQCECEDVKPGFMAAFGGDPSLSDATGGAAFDIDDVADGRLHFADAIPPLVTNAICEE